jgi:hypothetical protein
MQGLPACYFVDEASTLFLQKEAPDGVKGWVCQGVKPTDTQ